MVHHHAPPPPTRTLDARRRIYISRMTQADDSLDFVDLERTTAKLAEEERQANEREQNDLRWVMSTKQGRRFIWRRLSRAGVYQLSFNSDSAVMAFNEGTRKAGLELLDELMEACPDRYNEMLAEQKETQDAARHRVADQRNKRR
jgi:hypothetical protein